MKLYKRHFTEKESDITIISESKEAIDEAKKELSFQRRILEEYISKDQNFLKSFAPVKVDTDLEIVNLMSDISFICEVGPMATVAGALADMMIKPMKALKGSTKLSKHSLVENGGEMIIDSEIPFKVGLYAGINDLSFNLGFLIKKTDCPIGIGTSSASIGHAISLGEADAVTVFADNATIADGAATRVANEVKGKDIEKSIKKGLDVIDDLVGVKGAFISRNDKIGQTGYIPEMIKIDFKNLKAKNGMLTNIIPRDFEFFS